MKKIYLIILIISNFSLSQNKEWNLNQLQKKNIKHLDSINWNVKLFNQDKTTYKQYKEYFKGLPLTISAFPVADYEYAVASESFKLTLDSISYKGINIGYFKDENSEEVTYELTLVFLSNQAESNENSFVQSRNYPYLTAEGTFTEFNTKYDWVFTKSPDGFSFIMLNMKLFDLRFGKTILIIPQKDGSFYYNQINLERNTFKEISMFEDSLLTEILKAN